MMPSYEHVHTVRLDVAKGGVICGGNNIRLELAAHGASAAEAIEKLRAVVDGLAAQLDEVRP